MGGHFDLMGRQHLLQKIQAISKFQSAINNHLLNAYPASFDKKIQCTPCYIHTCHLHIVRARRLECTFLQQIDDHDYPNIPYTVKPHETDTP